MDGPGRRVAELARILNDGHPARPADLGGSFRLDTCLERVQRLERYVGERAGLAADDLDAVALLLLLDHYSSAVAILREAVRDSRKSVDDAAGAITHGGRLVKRCLQELDSPPVSAAPSAQQPASRTPDT